MLVCIEKDPDEPDFKFLAKSFGADYQPFNGQPSVQREHDAALRAQRQVILSAGTKAQGRPIKCFYVSDMDLAGYQMPEAFAKNLKVIYPHPLNSVECIAITPEQHAALKLPPMLSLKRYHSTVWQWYFEQTGFTTNICSEIDALDPEFLCQVLRDAITPYAHLDKDAARNEQLRIDANQTAARMNERLATVDWAGDRTHYEELLARWNQARVAARGVYDALQGYCSDLTRRVRARVKDPNDGDDAEDTEIEPEGGEE